VVNLEEMLKAFYQILHSKEEILEDGLAIKSMPFGNGYNSTNLTSSCHEGLGFSF
jgi:hypothetical protein